MRRERAENAQEGEEIRVEDAGNGGVEGDPEPPNGLLRRRRTKISTDQKREERRQLRKARAQQQDAQRSLKAEKMEREILQMNKKEDELEEEEMLLEETFRKQREELDRKNEETYKQWKDMISVEEEGRDGLTEEEKEAVYDKLLAHLRENTVVHLDEASAEFNLPTQEIAAKIQEFMQYEKISGILDERGKWIRITRQVEEKLVAYLHKNGRSHIADITHNLNEILQRIE